MVSNMLHVTMWSQPKLKLLKQSALPKDVYKQNLDTYLYSDVFQLSFASTPLFEPFSIPLLLEKLSSSLPSAKVCLQLNASPQPFYMSEIYFT